MHRFLSTQVKTDHGNLHMIKIPCGENYPSFSGGIGIDKVDARTRALIVRPLTRKQSLGVTERITSWSQPVKVTAIVPVIDDIVLLFYFISLPEIDSLKNC